jgi:hypothetical protein
VNGIVGIPIFVELLDYFNIIDYVGIDYMHAVCLNVFGRLLTNLFLSRYSSEPFSLMEKREEIEKEYLKFKYPHFKKRKPRKLEAFNTWKAVEFRLKSFKTSCCYF